MIVAPDSAVIVRPFTLRYVVHDVPAGRVGIGAAPLPASRHIVSAEQVLLYVTPQHDTLNVSSPLVPALETHAADPLVILAT
jgi:hypothetical protein